MTNKPTKKYYLTLLYPCRGKYDNQTKEITVEANNYHNGNGTFRFVDAMNTTISSYPTNFTIIKRIERLEE